jgi:DNA-binding CsgD family transcriptional regulator
VAGTTAGEPGTDAGSVEAAALAGCAAALECVAAPLVLVRPSGEILHSNGAGAALLRERRVLRSVGGALSFRRAADRKSLSAALARVAAQRQPEVLRLFGRPGEIVMLLTFSPVPGLPLVVVGAADLRGPLPLPPGWTRLAFGLTPQSAALAERLADGATLADFAEATGLPIGTVRTRLKKIAGATRTTSQPALVALLLRGAAVMAGLRAPGEQTPK